MAESSTYTASGFGEGTIASLFAEIKTVPTFINTNCAASASYTNIISSDYMGDLQAGDIIKFYKVDGSYEVRPKEWNGTRRYETVGDLDSVCAQLCAPREIAVKRNTCMSSGTRENMLQQVFDIRMKNTMEEEKRGAFRKVINMLMAGATATNKGNAAGKFTRNINLGSSAAPLLIDVTSSQTAAQIRRAFVDVFGRLQDSISQQDISGCTSSSFSYKMPQFIVDQMRYIENSEICCNWDNSIMMNGTTMFKDFLGKPMWTTQGGMMSIIPTGDGFKAPIVYSSAEAGHYTHGVSCATIDQEHDDETVVVTLTDGGIVVRPEYVAVAWVHVKTS